MPSSNRQCTDATSKLHCSRADFLQLKIAGTTTSPSDSGRVPGYPGYVENNRTALILQSFLSLFLPKAAATAADFYREKGEMLEA
eukprot:403422-Rhodomonas_salina.2